MNRSDMQAVLQQIEALSGTTWPEGAADHWLPLLLDVQVADAYQAVQEWYDQAEPQGRITPGYIRRRAYAIKELRERTNRRAIERAQEPAGVPPNAAARAVRAQLIELYGDNSGILTRRGRVAA